MSTPGAILTCIGSTNRGALERSPFPSAFSMWADTGTVQSWA